MKQINNEVKGKTMNREQNFSIPSKCGFKHTKNKCSAIGQTDDAKSCHKKLFCEDV